VRTGARQAAFLSTVSRSVQVEEAGNELRGLLRTRGKGKVSHALQVQRLRPRSCGSRAVVGAGSTKRITLVERARTRLNKGLHPYPY
jgi:hypothetical protein